MENKTQPAISFDKIKKDFGTETIISDLNLTIETGELFVLVGTSGSGKTTTLKMINELEKPTSGSIQMDGVNINEIPIRELRLDTGYVLQQIALFPTMTVAQNIAVIPEMRGWSKAKIKQATNDLLTQVGLDPKVYASRMPGELSGGEQQRIGILRAIAAQPKLVLMDEPFSALDPISRVQLQDLVLMLHQKLQNTIVFVTHDMTEALKLGDRIGVMSKGDLLQVDTPKMIANHPANQFVADFFANSQGNENPLDTTLSQLVEVVTLDQTKPAKTPKIFNLETPIGEVLAAFDQQEVVGVTLEVDSIAYLSKTQVLRYLSGVYLDQKGVESHEDKL